MDKSILQPKIKGKAHNNCNGVVSRWIYGKVLNQDGISLCIKAH